MKAPYFFVVIFFCCCTLLTRAQTLLDCKNEVYKLRDFLVANHVDPRKFDDEFSNNVFEQLLRHLDPDKLIFTETDIESLSVFRATLDDEINGRNWTFLSQLTGRYQGNLKRQEVWISQILQSDISWNVNEKFELDPKVFAKDESALKNRTRQWLKFEVLQKVTWFMDRDSVFEAEAIKIYEQEAKEHVKKIQLRNIRQISNSPDGFENHISVAFLNAITSVFDPHSVYLSASDFEHFKESLNTEGFYFGFTMDENARGEMQIMALTPGGAAWKSGEMQVGDLLIAIKTHDGEVVDLDGMSHHEVNSLLDEIKDKELEFTVRRADGVKSTFSLTKEKMESDENVVHSFILEGDQRVGYIHLPDFYTRWNDANEGSRCANDVAKEIFKLKKQGIEGLILDVRSNGGGSLYEAIAMAGIFIDEGALGMMRNNKGNITVLKDMNRGTVYDGPFVLMTNGHSASASEFLAAAIQDYNRGLVVGGQTYGKATGQTVIPLNVEHTAEIALQKHEAFVKVTTERLYRVTGKSIQGKGITPDVMLDDIYSFSPFHESTAPFSLVADSVVKNTYYKSLPAIPRKEIKERSGQRILSNTSFQQVTKSYQWYADNIFSPASITLLWSDFLKKSREKRINQDEIKQEHRIPDDNFEIKNTDASTGFSREDYARDYTHEWIEKLKHDIYLAETFNIISDLIKLH
jgi:carboxyl-terminal processing protease